MALRHQLIRKPPAEDPETGRHRSASGVAVRSRHRAVPAGPVLLVWPEPEPEPGPGPDAEETEEDGRTEAGRGRSGPRAGA
ncbi:hypothetical protein [Streptomyces sp. NPDC058664]|uniref:hypothetical protein n=1 Tax=unclassified Streptomyces TaxID=2593676 RepID=UPI0036547F32